MKKILLLTTALTLGLPMFGYANDKDMGPKTQYFFNKMDKDNNGAVSKAEHDAFGAEMFEKADTNKDGSLSIEEMRAAKKQEMQEYKDHVKTSGDSKKHR